MNTLKGKISLVYIGLVLMIAVVGLVSAVNMVLLQRSVNGLMTDNYISISAMEGARNALDEQKYAALSYLDLNDDAGINRYSAQDQAFQKAFQTERDDVTEPGEQKIVNMVVSDYAELRREFSIFENIRDVSGKVKSAAYFKDTMEPQIDKVGSELDQITTLNQNAMFHKKSAVAENAGTSLFVILAISLIAVTGGFLLSRYLVNRFLGPVHLLTESISKVRAGELNISLDVKTGDETEKLIHEFNEMISRLSAYEKSTMGSLMDEKNKSVAIVKSIFDPLIVLDSNYKIVMANSACEQFFEFSESKSLGRHFLEAIRNGELFNFITNSMESPDAVCEKVLYFEKENGYYLNVIVTKNLDAELNRANGCIVLMQNVTGFKELERIKTDFVATVSHEFKTPLTSIIMGASMLEGGNLGALNGEQMDVVKTVIEDGEKLSGFVNELLEVSRLESGRAVYSFEPCALSAIVESSVRQFAETAQRENVTIVNDVDENLPFVNADFERVTWVMNNLLSNALKYTKSGDFITIGTRMKDGFIETSVKDTGDGIPPEYLDRIFNKFVQVKGHDIEARGTGLGLAVAKEIVTAHRGEISVESEMDAGSTFRFTLPLFRGGMNG
ncbi:MAG: ATP-binding protein [Clostridia bacterium]|nr:ATP-binding protein [Clostridia bacterium]